MVSKVLGVSNSSPPHHSALNSQVTSSERPFPTSQPAWAPHFPAHCPVSFASLFHTNQHHLVLFVLSCPSLPRYHMVEALVSKVVGTLSVLFMPCLQCPKYTQRTRGLHRQVGKQEEWSAHQAEGTHLEHWERLRPVCEVVRQGT